MAVPIPISIPREPFTVELRQRAEAFYNRLCLSQSIIRAPDNPAQLLPEEVLVGRFQSGELDAAFFYSTEAADAKIPTVQPPAAIDPKARYTVAILRDAPNPAGAERFLGFLLGAKGREVLQEHGLNLVKPALSGDAQTIPHSVKSLIDTAQ